MSHIFITQKEIYIGTRVFIAAPTLWKILPSSIKSIENIAKFRSHLNTYLHNLAYPSYLTGISINLLTTGSVN